MADVVRIYSTSGTTGHAELHSADPQPISTTGSTIAPRSYAASGVSAGERIVSTYNAGPVRRRRGARRLRPAGARPHPGRHRQHRAADDGDRAARSRRSWRCTPSYALHLVEWARAARHRSQPRPACERCWSRASRAAASRRCAPSSRPAGAPRSPRRWASATSAVSLWGECEEQAGHALLAAAASSMSS